MTTRRLPLDKANMKRKGNIFENICSIENLQIADEKARRGKLRSYGVRRHDRSRDLNIQKLHEDLMSGRYRTSPYDVFSLCCDNGKIRDIYRLPYYPDRIVHHAIMNILEPIWVSTFTADTYSCISGRGIHAAVKKLKTQLREDPRGTQYCLKLDIKKFYPSIDHDILKSIIRRKIKDKRLLSLLDSVIDSAPGVPIGNYLSQYFANLYLTYFDHFLKEKLHIKYYYRYADDIVILSNNKPELHAIFRVIQLYLEVNLKLTVKNNYQVFPVDARGIDFLGYVFYHDYTMLRKSIKKNFCKAVATMNKKDISEKAYKQKTCSWLGWAKHCNSKNLIKTINKQSKYEIKFK